MRKRMILALALLCSTHIARAQGAPQPLSTADTATLERAALRGVRVTLKRLARFETQPVRVLFDSAKSRGSHRASFQQFVGDSLQVASGVDRPTQEGAIEYRVSTTRILHESDSTARVEVRIRTRPSGKCVERIYLVGIVRRDGRWQPQLAAPAPPPECQAQM